MAIIGYLCHETGRDFAKWGDQIKKISMDEGQILYFRSSSYDFAIALSGMVKEKETGTRTYGIISTLNYTYSIYDTNQIIYTVPEGYEAIVDLSIVFNSFNGTCRIWIDDGVA